MPAKVLIVRLGAFGDLIHALPAMAAVRDAWPQAHIDWLVDARYEWLLTFVAGLDRRIVVGAPAPSAPAVSSPGASARVAFAGAAGVGRAIRFLRAERYDVALDLQGLLKSAVLARASGARRVIGFVSGHLRERAARVFYTEAFDPGPGGHVIRKNVAMLAALGIEPGPIRFPLDAPLSPELAAALPTPSSSGTSRCAVINPGAGWPNKRWPAERFGAVAAHLRNRHGLETLVTWGPGEREAADQVARASDGAARVAPATSLGDLIALFRRARLVVAGDTGPLQIAAAVGAPIVALFGPTSPERNGPWAAADVSLSRFDQCECHHKRECRRATPCIETITLDEVLAAADRRLLA